MGVELTLDDLALLALVHELDRIFQADDVDAARLIQMVDPKTSITDAFRLADDVLRQGIGGISDLITKPGIINLDFADVRSIMQNAGSALMSIGYGSGETRTIDAAKDAISSPLLETSIEGATGVLYNITGSSNLTLTETWRPLLR